MCMYIKYVNCISCLSYIKLWSWFCKKNHLEIACFINLDQIINMVYTGLMIFLMKWYILWSLNNYWIWTRYHVTSFFGIANKIRQSNVTRMLSEYCEVKLSEFNRGQLLLFSPLAHLLFSLLILRLCKFTLFASCSSRMLFTFPILSLNFCIWF